MSQPAYRSFFWILFLLALPPATWAAAQDGDPSSADETTAPPADVPARLAEARRLIASRQHAGAAAILDRVVLEAPDNGLAWLLLGRARRGAGDPDGAIVALEKAADKPRARGPAMAERFFIEAERDRDAAAEQLARVRAVPGTDLSGLLFDPAVAALEGDPRFADLFPPAAEFAHPFAEGRAVIHDWPGEGRGYEQGWEARNLGDVDGDGVADAVSSARTGRAASGSPGKVYVYSGKSGRKLWEHLGNPGDFLGTGIEAAGDVDADGVPDVIAGAPGCGEAYVFSGRDGATLLTFRAAAEDGGQYGSSVAGAGDLDGDRHADLLVGAPSAGRGAGRVYAISGKDGTVLASFGGEAEGHGFGSVVEGESGAAGTLIVVGAPGAGDATTGRVYVYKDLSGRAAFTIEGASTAQALGGMFASVVGDVDGDGFPDVYASDWLDQAKGPMTGRVYVHSGKTGERLLELTGEVAGEGFGIGPARAGDVDGDGHDDLVVGAWQHHSAAWSGGRIYVLSGRDGRLLKTYTGRVPGETLGFDADGMGDVDGDGSFDFLVTSAWSLVRGPRSGRTMIISGTLE